MGKAIVVGITLLLLAIVVAVVVMWFRHKDDDGNLSTKQEKRLQLQLDAAARIMGDAGGAAQLEDCDYLSERTQTAIDQWLKEYGNMRKELNA